MYVPASSAVSDEKVLESFVERYDFATSWYASGPAVPTWNYSAVHVYGEPLAREDGDFTAGAIVAFEMPIDRIEGQFNLGQNRSQDDRLGMLKGLDAEGSPDADALAQFIRKTLVDRGV